MVSIVTARKAARETQLFLFKGMPEVVTSQDRHKV